MARDGAPGMLSRRVPIDEAALDGQNNFHLIRLVAALLVLFAHAFHLLERAGEEPIGQWFIWLDASLLGVAIFFFVSGFLVSRSWDRRESLISFLTARALRIAPALWVVLIVTVFGLGTLVTTLPASEYLRDRETLRYFFLNTLLATQYRLPGVFESNPVWGINGSLWTIPLEVVLYLILAVCGWIGLVDRCGSARSVTGRIVARPIAAAILIFFGFLLVSKVVHTGAQYYALAGYFLLGVLCYRFRERLALRLDFTIAMAVIALAAGRTPAGPILMPLALVSVILVVALHPALRMQPTWLHRHDYSYGTYLYGFPVQQTLIMAGIAAPLPLFGCATIGTLVCAALSWHLVERPVLEHKRWVDAWIAARIARRSGRTH